MRTKLFIIANALVTIAAIMGACKGREGPPAPSFNVKIRVEGRDFKSNGTKPIPAQSGRVRVIATVTAPPGDWQVALSSDGALSLPEADGGVVTAPIHSVRQKDAEVEIEVEVEVAAIPAAAGQATIRATVGAADEVLYSKVTRFVVDPGQPTVRVCHLLTSGECPPTSGGGGGGAGGGSSGAGGGVGGSGGDEALKAKVFAPPAGESEFRDGDRVGIEFALPGEPEAGAHGWSVSVATEGVLYLVNPDGTSAQSRTVDYVGVGPLIVPAKVTGAGDGRASGSIAGGPAGSRLMRSGSTSLFERRVEFLQHVGLETQNRITLCSSRVSGAVQVSLDTSQGGDVTPTDGMLAFFESGGVCPADFPGQVDLIWTGKQERPIWTVKDITSMSSTSIAIETLGTDLSTVRACADITWLAGRPDAGRDGSGGGGAGGEVAAGGGGAGAAGSGGAGGIAAGAGGGGGTAAGGGGIAAGGGGDAGAADAGKVGDGGTPRVDPAFYMRGRLFRTAGQTEPIADTAYTVIAPMGHLQDAGTSKTDALGAFAFGVSGATTANLTLLLDNALIVDLESALPCESE